MIRTPIGVADGKGLDSLRRLQEEFDAGGECLAPIIFQQIVDWKADLDSQFKRRIEVWDELRTKYHELANEQVSEQISHYVLEQYCQQ